MPQKKKSTIRELKKPKNTPRRLVRGKTDSEIASDTAKELTRRNELRSYSKKILTGRKEPPLSRELKRQTKKRQSNRGGSRR